MIAKWRGKFRVLDSTGTKVLGEHATEKEAQAQLAAIEISKAKKKGK